MTENVTATLTKYITDLHALLNHGVQVFERQIDVLKNEPHPQALAAVQEFQRTLRNNMNMLDNRARALDAGAAQALKNAATTVTGFFAGLMNFVRSDRASKAIRDDYTFLSHVAISNLMLLTTASGLGDDETAAVAEQGYRDAARLIMLIDRIIPNLVLEELRNDGLRTTNVATQVLKKIPDAWQREAAKQGLGSAA